MQGESIPMSRTGRKVQDMYPFHLEMRWTGKKERMTRIDYEKHNIDSMNEI